MSAYNQPIAIDSGGDSGGEEEYKIQRHHREGVVSNALQVQDSSQESKIPLFLIKLWNIIEDPSYYDVIRWDDSGYSFHITNPYAFCRNVLPQYFKHNNLNSLIRQLNMYGFRKMTPIERTSLARAESDQDHLEFSHAYFVRDHPELLQHIKRKAATKQSQEVANTAINAAKKEPSKDLSSVFDELRQLRDKQKHMEIKMNELIKDNELIWREMDHVRGAHIKQQQIVNKLVQFLVALVQPNKQQRLGKRHLLAIDEFQTKRGRQSDASGSDYNNLDTTLKTTQASNANEVLDSLINELATGGIFSIARTPRPNSNGPIIADVTDELDQLSTENLEQAIQQQQPIFGASDNGTSAQQHESMPLYTEYMPVTSKAVPISQSQRRYPARGNRMPQQYIYGNQQANTQRKMSQPASEMDATTQQRPPSVPYSISQPRQIRQTVPQQQFQQTQPVIATPNVISVQQIPTTMVVPSAARPIIASGPPQPSGQYIVTAPINQQQISYNPSIPPQSNVVDPSNVLISNTANPASPAPIIVQPRSNESTTQYHVTASSPATSEGTSAAPQIAPVATGLQMSDIDEYINRMNSSIKDVHNSIGNHWNNYETNDNFDFDNLLEDAEWDYVNSKPVSPLQDTPNNGYGGGLQDTSQQSSRTQLSSLNVPTATPIAKN